MSDRDQDPARRSITNIIVNPALQFKYILIVVLGGFMFTGLCAALFYSYIQANYHVVMSVSLLPAELKDQMNDDMRNFAIELLALCFCFLVFVTGWALYVSHRISGPLYRFKQIFDEIHSGNGAARIRLRPTDQFHDVAVSFNNMMDKLKN